MNAAESSGSAQRTESHSNRNRLTGAGETVSNSSTDGAGPRDGGVSQSSKPVDMSDNGSEAERFQSQAAKQNRSLIFITTGASHPHAVKTSEGVRDLIVRGIFGATPGQVIVLKATLGGRIGGGRFIRKRWGRFGGRLCGGGRPRPRKAFVVRSGQRPSNSPDEVIDLSPLVSGVL